MYQVLLPYMTTITQIEIENTKITLFYLPAASFAELNNHLEKRCNELTRKYLKKLQNFHNFVCYFCKNIHAVYNINITISVFGIF